MMMYQGLIGARELSHASQACQVLTFCSTVMSSVSLSFAVLRTARATAMHLVGTVL